MNVARLEAREQEIMRRLEQKVGSRREGRHLTDALRCNVKSFGLARMEAAGHPAPRFDHGSLLRMATGIGLGLVIEEGHVSQIETLSREDDTVGTIDVFWRGRCIEIKVTWRSSRRDILACDDWIEQIEGYVARNIPDGAATATGEIWAVHLGGDMGKKFCPDHGVPETAVRRKHPETGGQRLYCPECGEFLADGDRDPGLRCHALTWTAEELRSMHTILTDRHEQLRQDILNPEFQPQGTLPPVRWGRDYECKKCQVKDWIGCPGMEARTVEHELEAALLQRGMTTEEIVERFYREEEVHATG